MSENLGFRAIVIPSNLNDSTGPTQRARMQMMMPKKKMLKKMMSKSSSEDFLEMQFELNAVFSILGSVSRNMSC